jgi:hypothetical protein
MIQIGDIVRFSNVYYICTKIYHKPDESIRELGTYLGDSIYKSDIVFEFDAMFIDEINDKDQLHIYIYENWLVQLLKNEKTNKNIYILTPQEKAKLLLQRGDEL